MAEPVDVPQPERRNDEAVVSIAVRIEPFLMRTGAPFTGEVGALAEQMTRYVAENLSRFTEAHAQAGLFVAVSVERGMESAGHEYREGHFVKAEAADV